MKNEFVKQQILKYHECIDNKVLNNTNYDTLIELLKSDLSKLKTTQNQNTFTKISLLDCENYLKYNNVDFRCIANSVEKVFFDYYIANITEPIKDEIFDLMTEFFSFFLNRSMIYNQLTIFNLIPVKINNFKNHSDDYYHLLYQNLLANGDVYLSSENLQNETFRQYCHGLCKVLILNNKFDYFIDFYNKANRIIEPKEIIEYFIELKDKIDDNYFNYDLCKFLCHLFDKLDFSFYENYINIDKEQSIEEQIDKNLEKDKRTGLNIVYIFGKILGEVCEFLKEFKQDKILFDGFDKYSDDLYNSKMQTAKTVEEIQVRRQILMLYNQWFNEHKENAGRMIAISTIRKVNDDAVEWSCNGEKISINCLDYMEQIIDYLIYLKNNNNTDYTINDIEQKIYRLLNLYIRAKNINSKIISSEDKSIIEFKEEIETRLDKLQDVVVLVNKYLSSEQTEQQKEQIVKNFFKSAFQNYTNRGLLINASSEYSITDLSENDIEFCYNAIKNNQNLIDQIVTGEKLIEPYVRASDMNYDYATGDYTNLVVCQIKAIERYMKEVLIQYHIENIWKTKPKNGEFYRNGWKKIETKGNRIILNTQNPTAEDLHNLECGSATYALLMAYIKEGNFQDFNVSYKFYSKGIQEVRNGHLHIDSIDTINDALKRRSQTAFWIMYLITRLGEKGILNR